MTDANQAVLGPQLVASDVPGRRRQPVAVGVPGSRCPVFRQFSDEYEDRIGESRDAKTQFKNRL